MQRKLITLFCITREPIIKRRYNGLAHGELPLRAVAGGPFSDTGLFYPTTGSPLTVRQRFGPAIGGDGWWMTIANSNYNSLIFLRTGKSMSE
jgi:hypothetical protein